MRIFFISIILSMFSILLFLSPLPFFDNRLLLFYQLFCIFFGAAFGFILIKFEEKRLYIASFILFLLFAYLKVKLFVGEFFYYDYDSVNNTFLVFVSMLIICYLLERNHFIFPAIFYVGTNWYLFYINDFSAIIIFNLLLIIFLIRQRDYVILLASVLVQLGFAFLYFDKISEKFLTLTHYYQNRYTLGFTNWLNDYLIHSSNISSISELKIHPISFIHILKKFSIILIYAKYGYVLLTVFLILLFVWVWNVIRFIKSKKGSFENIIVFVMILVPLILGVLRAFNIIPFLPSYNLPFIGFGVNGVFTTLVLIGYMLSDEKEIVTKEKYYEY